MNDLERKLYNDLGLKELEKMELVDKYEYDLRVADIIDNSGLDYEVRKLKASKLERVGLTGIVSIDLSKSTNVAEDITKVFSLFIADGSDLDERDTKSPYTIRTKANSGSLNMFIFRNDIADITYLSGEYRITIYVKLEYYRNVIRNITRNPSNSEYVHYLGMSAGEINNIKIPKPIFTEFSSIHYYGGTSKVYCDRVEDVEMFENMVITGNY